MKNKHAQLIKAVKDRHIRGCMLFRPYIQTGQITDEIKQELTPSDTNKSNSKIEGQLDGVAVDWRISETLERFMQDVEHSPILATLKETIPDNDCKAKILNQFDSMIEANKEKIYKMLDWIDTHQKTKTALTWSRDKEYIWNVNITQVLDKKSDLGVNYISKKYGLKADIQSSNLIGRIIAQKSGEIQKGNNEETKRLKKEIKKLKKAENINKNTFYPRSIYKNMNLSHINNICAKNVNIINNETGKKISTDEINNILSEKTIQKIQEYDYLMDIINGYLTIYNAKPKDPRFKLDTGSIYVQSGKQVVEENAILQITDTFENMYTSIGLSGREYGNDRKKLGDQIMKGGFNERQEWVKSIKSKSEIYCTTVDVLNTRCTIKKTTIPGTKKKTDTIKDVTISLNLEIFWGVIQNPNCKKYIKEHAPSVYKLLDQSGSIKSHQGFLVADNPIVQPIKEGIKLYNSEFNDKINYTRSKYNLYLILIDYKTGKKLENPINLIEDLGKNLYSQYYKKNKKGELKINKKHKLIDYFTIDLKIIQYCSNKKLLAKLPQFTFTLKEEKNNIIVSITCKKSHQTCMQK